MREIGLFCGTFNPIHIGHLLIAECARDQFHLEKVIFVTSALPPHRQDGLLDAEQRHELVKVSIAGNKYFETSRLEIERQGPSYTIDTIASVKQEYGNQCRINLIIGEDNLPYLSQWHQPEEIIKLCRLLVAPRDFPTPNPKYNSEHPATKNIPMKIPEDNIAMLDFPLIAISASAIRERLKNNRTVKYMVAPEVNEILLSKEYYKDCFAKNIQK